MKEDNKVIDFSLAKIKKYELRFCIGEVLYYDAFKEILIDNNMENYFGRKLGKEWGFNKVEDQMLKGLIQYLIAWTWGDENISIIMGLKYVDLLQTESRIYYKVIFDTRDISKDYFNFNEAFLFFKDYVRDYIKGV